VTLVAVEAAVGGIPGVNISDKVSDKNRRGSEG
jgi:hypothetical protein